jgi:hypothetical protein
MHLARLPNVSLMCKDVDEKIENWIGQNDLAYISQAKGNELYRYWINTHRMYDKTSFCRSFLFWHYLIVSCASSPGPRAGGDKRD